MTDIEANRLVKRFGTIEATRKISFAVAQGELFGLLGPNGAGKTTTINMLTGLARPDAGAIRIRGVDCTRNPKAGQRLIGVVPDESNLYPELTGLENLCFCAALYGIRKRERQARARKLLGKFGLADAAQRKFAGYSKGMKRKLTIAAGIIHQPAILFLDEPTTGIDVVGARQIRQLITDLHQEGTTILLTTHYIEEAERLCERIAFIVSGQIVRVDTVQDLMRPVQGSHIVEIAIPNGAADQCGPIEAVFPRLRCRAISDSLLRLEGSGPIRVGLLVRFLEDRGLEVAEARKVQPTLEDLFVEITGVEAAAMKREKEKAGSGG